MCCMSLEFNVSVARNTFVLNDGPLVCTPCFISPSNHNKNSCVMIQA